MDSCKKTHWFYSWVYQFIWAAHDRTNKMACAPSEDSDQPGHPSSLIRVFVVRMKKAWVLNYPLSTKRRLWSDWASAQAELRLRRAHNPFCWFCHEVAQYGYGNNPVFKQTQWFLALLIRYPFARVVPKGIDIQIFPFVVSKFPKIKHFFPKWKPSPQ